MHLSISSCDWLWASGPGRAMVLVMILVWLQRTNHKSCVCKQCIDHDSFEDVCLELTSSWRPPCMEGRSSPPRHSRYHLIRGIRGIGVIHGIRGWVPNPKFRWRRLSKNRLWDPLGGIISKVVKKGATRDPKAAQRESQRIQGRPKAFQRWQNSAPRRDKRRPMALQMVPKEPHGTLKRVERRPIYTKTPNQPHQRPLCYAFTLQYINHDSCVVAIHKTHKQWFLRVYNTWSMNSVCVRTATIQRFSVRSKAEQIHKFIGISYENQ